MDRETELVRCPFSDASLELRRTDGADITVIICPGGGYEWLSDREGAPVARMLESAGIRAAILRYSVSPVPLMTLPLREAAWALRMVRGRFAGKVAICGFSSGGHVAASLGVYFADMTLFPDAGERCMQKPDGMILCYPVICSGEYAHKRSFQRLADGDAVMVDYMSLEKHVTAATPPAFIWHTASDKSVPVENSLCFYSALVSHGVMSELHVFPRGEHGLSLATAEVQQQGKARYPDVHIARWAELAVEWLRTV